jgi:MFS family permease
MVLGLAIIALWARRSLAAQEPFINLRLLASRNVSLAILIAVLLSLGTMQITLVFSAYGQNPVWTAAGLGLTAMATGLIKLPSNVLSFFAGPFSGWLQQKRGIRLPILCGGLLGTAGWLAALTFPTVNVQVVVLLCVISFGTTMLNAAIPNVIVASVPEERTSEAIGALSVLRGMAQSIGSQVIAVMLTVGALVTPEGGARIPSATGFTITMATIAGLTLAAALVSLLLRPDRSHHQPVGEPEPAVG